MCIHSTRRLVRKSKIAAAQDVKSPDQFRAVISTSTLLCVCVCVHFCSRSHPFVRAVVTTCIYIHRFDGDDADSWQFYKIQPAFYRQSRVPKPLVSAHLPEDPSMAVNSAAPHERAGCALRVRRTLLCVACRPRVARIIVIIVIVAMRRGQKLITAGRRS